jgi:acyl-coenzyme A thioesterase PaaI-like protein
MNTASAIAVWWTRLGSSRPGRMLFARLLRILIPYTGTVQPHVHVLRPGYARITMRDRRRTRNHLGSVHAVAVTNLGELASGLALVPWLQDARGIVVRLTTEYHHKARGTLLAQGNCEVPVVRETMDYETRAHITDTSGEIVATVTAHWRLAPLP